MADRLTGSGTKQGDHVFNDLRTAIERPIDSMREARVEGLDGEHFLTDFLPYGVDLAKRILRDPIWQTVRQFTATPGEEPQALLRLSRVAANRPVLAGITKEKLVSIHSENAGRFGAETHRFESEFLTAMRHALAVATEHPDTPNNANLIFGTDSPTMAFQSLVDTAFDPAAALVIVIAHADRLTVLGQSSGLTFLESVWGTIDPWRPALWTETWNQFRGTRQRNPVDFKRGSERSKAKRPAREMASAVWLYDSRINGKNRAIARVTAMSRQNAGSYHISKKDESLHFGFGRRHRRSAVRARHHHHEPHLFPRRLPHHRAPLPLLPWCRDRYSAHKL